MANRRFTIHAQGQEVRSMGELLREEIIAEEMKTYGTTREEAITDYEYRRQNR